MSEIFKNIPKIEYEGKNSTNPLAFKYYDANRVILGKTMREHLPFAMAWWHNLCAGGTDMFGRDTIDKSFGAQKGTMAHAKAKVDAGFEFMQKLGIKCKVFAPATPLVSTHYNYRDHRKIAVIDGQVAFTGAVTNGQLTEHAEHGCSSRRVGNGIAVEINVQRVAIRNFDGIV